MAILLRRQDIDRLLDMSELIDVMERTQIQYSMGKVVQPMRSTLRLPRHPGDLLLMPGYVEGTDSLGVKVLTLRLDNPARGLPIVQAVIVLIDAVTGTPLSIMDGGSITAARTAAVSGVASRYLARPDASRLAIIGTGRQARTHLWAMICVRPIKAVRVFDLAPRAAVLFAEEMSSRFGVSIEVSTSVEEAVRWAEILVLSTSSRTPVVASSWVGEGLHINSIASLSPDSREVDTETVRRSKLVVDSREAALHESGDLLLPISEGAIGADHLYAEVGEIAGGVRVGRTSADEITLYKSLGLAVQDVATASLLYEKAVQTRTGLEFNFS